MPDPIHVEDHSLTTAGTQKLFLGRDDADLIRGKRILIMDDVISTGGSLKAMEALVQEAGVVTGKVAVLRVTRQTARHQVPEKAAAVQCGQHRTD